MIRLFLVSMLLPAWSWQAPAGLQPDRPIDCSSCSEWNVVQEPFRLFGNSYYVGVAGLSAVLVTSDGGLILLDGGLPQSAPLIQESIRALGFQTGQIRLIVNSHAHFDHAGGIAALQRASGAVVAASPAGALALKQGGPTAEDPQYAFGRESTGFPAVSKVRVVSDGETLRVGDLAITAHFTPGHTPGATTWTWRSCEGEKCLDMVYADSLNPVSAPGFEFSRVPGLVEAFSRSIDRVAALPCDLLIAVHPAFSRVKEKLAGRSENVADPFQDPAACRSYAETAAGMLSRRLAAERR